jgi:hypothetical protein
MALKTLLPEHFDILSRAKFRGNLIIQQVKGHKWPKDMFLAETLASLYFLARVRAWDNDGSSFVEFILTDSGDIVLSLRPPGQGSYLPCPAETSVHIGVDTSRETELLVEPSGQADPYAVVADYIRQATQPIWSRPDPHICEQWHPETGCCFTCGAHHGIKF